MPSERIEKNSSLCHTAKRRKKQDDVESKLCLFLLMSAKVLNRWNRKSSHESLSRRNLLDLCVKWKLINLLECPVIINMQLTGVYIFLWRLLWSHVIISAGSSKYSTARKNTQRYYTTKHLIRLFVLSFHNFNPSFRRETVFFLIFL